MKNVLIRSVSASGNISKLTTIRYKRRPFVSGLGSIVNLGGDSRVFKRYMANSDVSSIENDWQMVGSYIRESFNGLK